MSTWDLRAAIERDGFVVVPGVFTPEQVAALRSSVLSLFQRPSPFEGDIEAHPRIGSVRFDICTRYQTLRWLLVHPPLVAALSCILGDRFVFLPEMSAHRAGFGDWHKDTTSQERAGHMFHWEDGCLIVEAAIYLQPNDPKMGGGLDVIPGSHRQPDSYLDAIDRTAIDKVRTKLKTWGLIPTKKGYSVPSKAGDLVVFDFRIDHKATWPAPRGVLRASQDKLAIFMACSRDNEYAQLYTRYIATRSDYQYLKGHRYPDDLQALVRAHGVELLQVS